MATHVEIALHRMASDQDLCALLLGILHVLINLFDCLVVDKRPMGDAFVKTVADFEFVDLLSETGRELCIDAALHEYTISADAWKTFCVGNIDRVVNIKNTHKSDQTI